MTRVSLSRLTTPPQRLFLYAMAAAVGDSVGQTFLARLYKLGRGVERGIVAAAGLLRRSVEAGSLAGQYNLARPPARGESVEENLGEA